MFACGNRVSRQGWLVIFTPDLTLIIAGGLRACMSESRTLFPVPRGTQANFHVEIKAQCSVQNKCLLLLAMISPLVKIEGETNSYAFVEVVDL